MTQTTPAFSDGLDDICQGLLIESYENLDDLDRNLVALEQDPSSRLPRVLAARVAHPRG